MPVGALKHSEGHDYRREASTDANATALSVAASGLSTRSDGGETRMLAAKAGIPTRRGVEAMTRFGGRGIGPGMVARPLTPLPFIPGRSQEGGTARLREHWRRQRRLVDQMTGTNRRAYFPACCRMVWTSPPIVIVPSRSAPVFCSTE
jgi:hypothetical protein